MSTQSDAPSCPNCGESPMFRSVVHDCCVQASELQARVDAIGKIPVRMWDEDDADSAEARSARAYNHALFTVRGILAGVVPR